MKTEEPKKGSSLTGAALAIAAALALALGGFTWWLKKRAEEMRVALDTSITQYDQMKDLKRRILDLRDRAPKGAQEEVDTMKIATFLSSKAAQVGLPNPIMRHTIPAKSGGWSEIATTISLRAPSRDAAITRGPFIDFLTGVERERPYLKSKTLSMQFGGGPDLSSAEVTISYFKRD